MLECGVKSFDLLTEEKGKTEMTTPMMNVGAERPKLKVSISARLIAAFAFMVPTIGGALSSLYLMRVMNALKENEAVGLTVVFAGLTESITPALGSLYLGAFGGLIVIIVLIIRMFMQTKTASPAAWFFIFCGFLFLIPAGLFFEAQSMIIEVLTIPDSSTNMGTVGSNVSLFLFLSIGATLLVSILMLVISVIPFSTKSKPRWGSLFFAVFVEFLIIIAVVAFQLRFLWLYKAAMSQ